MRISDWSSDVCSSDRLGGRKFTKRNCFTDFIACAEYLAREGYTAKGKIVAYSLSAGGLLVGASMNIAPALWGGVIAKVPFVDMLNTMSDAAHPLVPLFRPDWGDPLADPKAYDYIASISPYENRSEEHTSELQSLMRLSYAVFCLKKKKNTNTQNT